ncbi:MAG: glycosyltransferase [Christensenellaceae bacterium]|jgi:glycosyltransferase involved in cell wall biosynthesis|nr:glycosyltransferase [Christensenellaceae bacterium]
MRVLVLVADYPSANKIPLMYVHVRNKYYIQDGIDVVVLNFRAKADYVLDGISVITLSTFKRNIKTSNYDLAISHAANIRNHYRFLKMYNSHFPRLLFFFHGHEILKLNVVYPKPYAYMPRNSKVGALFISAYDTFKLYAWRKYFNKLLVKSFFVFVSNYIFREFNRFVKPIKPLQPDQYAIIYNCIGRVFESLQYTPQSTLKYDFVTIRSYLDQSTYAVDTIINTAFKYPNYKFCLVGCGRFFDYYQKPDNVEFLDCYLTHDQIVELLNHSRCALMPTRHDTQGLLACEMATFGIPLITSDIPVCIEVFSEFKNVFLAKTVDNAVELNEDALNALCDGTPYRKCDKYFARNTVKGEIDIIKNMGN